MFFGYCSFFFLNIKSLLFEPDSYEPRLSVGTQTEDFNWDNDGKTFSEYE